MILKACDAAIKDLHAKVIWHLAFYKRNKYGVGSFLFQSQHGNSLAYHTYTQFLRYCQKSKAREQKNCVWFIIFRKVHSN